MKSEDKSDLTTFLGQCEDKFCIDPRAFKADKSKVGPAVSLLQRRPEEVVSSLALNESCLETVTGLVPSVLDRC